jgi:hypothetical protein
MGKIGTNDVTVGSGKAPKNFIPGNHSAKIIGMSFQEVTFKDDVTKAWVILDLETKPLGGEFEGWFIDKDNESLGRRMGQTGRIKSDPFGYEDKSFKGNDYSIHKSTIQFLKSMEIEITGKTAFMDSINDKFDTYEEMCEAFFTNVIPADFFMEWCIGGKKELGDDGYAKYWMNLPKWTRGKKLYAHPDKANNLVTFHEQLHVYDTTGGAAKGGAPAAATDTPTAAPTFSSDADADGPDWDKIQKDGASTEESPFATTAVGAVDEDFPAEEAPADAGNPFATK